MKLRPAQQEILTYRSGRMGISAVPGSGKTFVLTQLAARLITDNELDLERGQQVLIVTYLNAGVDNFKARIGQLLQARGLPQAGYDVRTLHSLAREIIQTAPAAAGVAVQDLASGNQQVPVLDEAQSALFLTGAVQSYIRDAQAAWSSFLPDEAIENPRLRTRWRATTEKTARNLIRMAKNHRYHPSAILEQLGSACRVQAESGASDEHPTTPARFRLLDMLTHIYQRYQAAIETQGALDFDDLVWRAVDLLEKNPSLVEALCFRWPYILEDEAQDSVPLQEVLLSLLTGPTGNWVRVGDPNQAITSSFTSANPRYFREFLTRPDVTEYPLPESGRSAPRIIGLANHLVQWSCSQHPVPEVRQVAFRPQMIRPTPPGDSQPNPPDRASKIRIRVFGHRERQELPAVAAAAWEHCQQHGNQTIAILVPTNDSGFAVAAHLDSLGADYDELLRGGSRTREIAAALHAVLALLADPLQAQRLEACFSALLDMEVLPIAAPASLDRERIQTLLRSVRRPEALLYPTPREQLEDALPQNIPTPADIAIITAFVEKVRGLFATLALPPDALVLTLADDLLQNENDLAIAYQISGFFRTMMDSSPSWRLPELVARLDDVARGSIHLIGSDRSDAGYQPEPGRVTLTTQHRAKGLEWDTVFLVGIDGFWIPSNLDVDFLGVQDFLGGDPSAEAVAQLKLLMAGDAELLPDLSATETAHIEVIAERLRLLYVGITRARRNLYISRSKAITSYDHERDRTPASALGALYQYLTESSR